MKATVKRQLGKRVCNIIGGIILFIIILTFMIGYNAYKKYSENHCKEYAEYYKVQYENVLNISNDIINDDDGSINIIALCRKTDSYRINSTEDGVDLFYKVRNDKYNLRGKYHLIYSFDVKISIKNNGEIDRYAVTDVSEESIKSMMMSKKMCVLILFLSVEYVLLNMISLIIAKKIIKMKKSKSA